MTDTLESRVAAVKAMQLQTLRPEAEMRSRIYEAAIRKAVDRARGREILR